MSRWQKVKNSYHWCRALLANVYYGFPSKQLYVIGVTGTNGKTTTVNLIASILERAGFLVGVSSTVNVCIGKKRKTNASKFTTPDAFSYQRFLADCVKAGCRFAVVEVSSHALDQYRDWGTDYDCAVITNVTREHLDYHVTMEDYRRAKQRLFRRVAFNSGSKQGCPSGVIVVNCDMERPGDFILGGRDRIYIYRKEKIAGDPYNKLSVGKKGSTQKADNMLKTLTLEPSHMLEARKLASDSRGSSFRVDGTSYHLKIPGVFNVENALAALAVGRICGIPEKTAKQALESFAGVSGRMEYVANKKGISIIIDYAVTPDSMEQVGSLVSGNFLQRKKGGSLIWVFGSCGNRDRGKRPIMGEIGARHADVVIITNEDPYYEDPTRIIDEVFSGVLRSGTKKENQNAFRIFDRREAIEKALTMAKEGDTVLITGKGAEENMKIGDALVPWNDRSVVEEVLISL